MINTTITTNIAQETQRGATTFIIPLATPGHCSLKTQKKLITDSKEQVASGP